MKKEVVICDADNAVPAQKFGEPGKYQCRHLADGICRICERDMCDEHLAFRLVLTVSNTVPNPVPHNPADRTNAYPITAREDPTRICCDCSTLFYRGGFDVNTHLQAAFNAIRIEMIAHHAALGLKDTKR